MDSIPMADVELVLEVSLADVLPGPVQASLH